MSKKDKVEVQEDTITEDMVSELVCERKNGLKVIKERPEDLSTYVLALKDSNGNYIDLMSLDCISKTTKKGDTIQVHLDKGDNWGGHTIAYLGKSNELKMKGTIFSKQLKDTSTGKRQSVGTIL